jgi:hypothetical protein
VSISGASNKPTLSARDWLRANGYNEVAQMIDDIMAEWKIQGKATRRNWWEVLAGDSRGNPRKIAGRTFPIIKAIRKRQALPKTATAQSNMPRQVAPKIRPSGRWANHRV